MIFFVIAPFGIGLGELSGSAADRRARRGLPAPQRDRVLAVCARRHDRVRRAGDVRRAAATGWTAYAPLTEIPTEPGPARTSGSSVC